MHLKVSEALKDENRILVFKGISGPTDRELNCANVGRTGMWAGRTFQ